MNPSDRTRHGPRLEIPREPLARLRQAAGERLSRVEIVPIEVDVPKNGHPLAKFAGMFREDALFDQFVEDMAAYRREVDEERAG